MKMFKIIPVVLILLFAISCDLFSELFESDDPKGSGSIIGSWLESDATISLVLTTNSNQTANNFLNSTGEIAVTGDVAAKLPLMLEIPPEDADDGHLLIVTATAGVLGFSDTSYILLLDGSGNTSDAMLTVNDTIDFSATFMSDQANYTFGSGTLTVNNSTLQDNDLQMSVNISGTIASQQVNINANSATTLSFDASHFYEFGSTVTTFNEDSTFVSSEDTGIGDDTGTWDIVGDTLKITTQQEVDDPVNGGTTFVDTTWAFNYVNNGNEIILSQTIPVCDLEDDDMTCAEMYESIELLFGLDAGSITDAQLIYQLLFERTTAKPFARITESSTPSDAVYIMKRITDFGEVIRSK